MNAEAVALPDARRGDALGALLLGTLAAAMVARRIELALACVLLAIGLAWTAGARLPSAAWWRMLAWGCGLGLLFNLYLVPGRSLALPAVFGYRATVEGLFAGIHVALRLMGAAVALRGIQAAWRGDRAADHFASMMAPLERLRIPVRGFRETMRLALRMMPAALEEHRRIRRLQTLRAGGPPRGLWARLARERAAWIPTMIGAVESAERLALALEARHYRERPIPPDVRIPRWAAGAGVAILMIALFTPA